jgi:hypothetical protein
MGDLEEDKQAEKRKTVIEQRCPMQMHEKQPCGRPIHAAPLGVDELPVCLMHSKDPNKNDAAFQEEFDRILRDAGERDADFTKFVIPSANYARREFRAKCIFLGATFTQAADFSYATFNQYVTFLSAAFTQHADFRGATFTQNVDFTSSMFTQGAVFRDATFTQYATFLSSEFRLDADFIGATFTQVATFNSTRFVQAAHFIGATFTQDARFNMARFAQAAQFSGVRFTGTANFLNATFAGDVSFAQARFYSAAVFCGANFRGQADFNHATFFKEADIRYGTSEKDVIFAWTQFNDIAEFDERSFSRAVTFESAVFRGTVNYYKTHFRRDGGSDAGPIFMNARFYEPEKVLFYDTYLGQALFHSCDVSRFVFRDVIWGVRINRKRKVFEEDVELNSRVTQPLEPKKDVADERNYNLIAELYQQLKKNYDERRDYWTAGDYHYGEMEMKRLSSPRRNPVLRWLHRNLGLAAWYQYASDYGESYVKPVLRLLIVLALFTLGYPACGLHRVSTEKGSLSQPVVQTGSLSANTDVINYANFFQFQSAYPNGKLHGTGGFFAQSAMTSVSVASLRRDFADYEPQSVSSRFAALIELLLTSTLVALFLLAVRRQFRR